MRVFSTIVILSTALAAAGCSGSPIQPPPPGQIQLLCPLPVVSEATGPQGADVSFDAPAPTGGREPYTVECAPGSGSTFPIGATTVTCTATDADRAQVSCGFTVTVRVSQTMSRTKFMAFGDSITDGKVSLVPLLSLAGPDTYPYKLQQMLLQKYPSQAISVSNQGDSGEHLGKGAIRLPGVLDAEKPEVLLLLEGVNAVWIRPTNTQAADLRTMIMSARQRNVDVIIATVMPVTAAWENDGHVGSMARIRALNTRIFQLAAEFNLGPVVDLFALFEANPHFIGADGLHPTVEGQTRIAEAFHDEIVRRYDVRSTSSLGSRTMSPIDGW